MIKDNLPITRIFILLFYVCAIPFSMVVLGSTLNEAHVNESESAFDDLKINTQDVLEETTPTTESEDESDMEESESDSKNPVTNAPDSGEITTPESDEPEDNQLVNREETDEDVIQEEEEQTNDTTSVDPIQGGLLAIGVLGSANLDATHTIENNQDKIRLHLKGSLPVDVQLLADRYVIFEIPENIMKEINLNTLRIDYELPALLPILPPNRGHYLYGDANMQVDFDNNLVSVNFTSLIGLSLLGQSGFTLTFDINHLPVSSNTTYTFCSQMTDQLIEVEISEQNKFTCAEIAAPGGELAFEDVPEILQFETTKISTEPTVVHRALPNWTIKVKDLRHQKQPWKVMVHANPFTSLDNPALKLMNALVYVDSNKVKHPLSTESIAVFQNSDHTNDTIGVNWAADEGLLLDIQPGNILVGDYETTLHWTLVDAP